VSGFRQRFSTLRAYRFEATTDFGDEALNVGIEHAPTAAYAVNFPAIGKNAIMSDFHEAFRQRVQQKPSHELNYANRHGLLFSAVFVVFVGERDSSLRFVVCDDPSVGDADSIGVPSKVFNDIVSFVKRLFQIAEKLDSIEF
jgi:hypothetical protein